MYAYAVHMITPTLLIALLPSIASLSYPIYGVKSYRRSVPATSNLNNPLSYYQSSLQQYDEQPPLSSHYRQQRFDSDVGANYYVDDGLSSGGSISSRSHNTGHRLPQYQSFGLPTYQGEYKPKQYYYAHGPSYNYYDDRLGANNPMDDLHEKMLQEDERERQSNLPVGQEQWYQNAGHPRTLTDTFLNNLITYNSKLNAERERELEKANEYIDNNDDNDNAAVAAAVGGVDDDVDDMYYGEIPNTATYDMYDQQQPFHAPIQTHQMPKIAQTNHFRTQSVTASDSDADDYFDYDKLYDRNHDTVRDDEDVRELKSLSQNKQTAKTKATMTTTNNDDSYQMPHRFADTASYHGAEATADDYDDGEDAAWINWDRKRSEDTHKQIAEIQSKNMESLQALERQLKTARKDKVSAATATATTTTSTVKPDTTTSPTMDAVVNLMKLKHDNQREGQKEVVLSRPATPVRHIFSDPVLAALSKANDKQVSTTFR